MERTVESDRRTAVRLATKRALRLAAGVAVTLSGVAITGGSFGLFAVIGIPVLAVGLSLISSEVNRDGPSTVPPRLGVGAPERSALGTDAQSIGTGSNNDRAATAA